MKARVKQIEMSIPTYGVGKEEKLPMFFEKRVYQGSSGRVYPNPVTEKISDEKSDRKYIAVVLENDWLKVVVLPELGGRIYSAYDKKTDYDFVYRNRVIKPALVGLLGPWVSGGIEFNWPQHHRPTTFKSVPFKTERQKDGACVYVGETEGMFGLKQVTRIKLYDDAAFIEIATDVYNGGALPQTFLWWANPAYAVNNDTVTVMPPDVNAVMDHGKRAVSTFPIATGEYYKMDYSRGVDISRYKNIPVPTSFMAYKSEFDFIGGYDYGRKAGLLHVADHRIAPGKKQWTWGCGDFGKAWDDNLTDEDGPYVELMTGCFTDNQPDFTFIQPREKKSFTQYFMPYAKVGKISNANKDMCFGVENGVLTVYASRRIKGVLRISDEKNMRQEALDLLPEDTLEIEGVSENADIFAEYEGGQLEFSPEKVKKFPVPSPATACPPPEQCENCRSLLLFGRHIEQYRHATRRAEDYYEEGLRREPDNAELNTAYGLLLLRRGEYEESLKYSLAAIDALTVKNGNPRDTECYYNAGVAFFKLNDAERARDMFAKCLWGDNGHRALACLVCVELRDGKAAKAREYAEACARGDLTDLRALNALARIYRDCGEIAQAQKIERYILKRDPLNAEAAYAAGRAEMLSKLTAAEARITAGYMFDEGRYGYARGFLREYRRLSGADDTMTLLVEAYAEKMCGGEYKPLLKAAECASTPSFARGLAEREVCQAFAEESFAAVYQLGNEEYDASNYCLAAKCWQKALELKDDFAPAKRALALYYFNKKGEKERALDLMKQAFEEDKGSRMLFELVGLYRTLGMDVFGLLAAHPNLVAERDDLYAEYCGCLVRKDESARALQMLLERKFHPWEGGEGKVTGIYKKANIALAEACADKGDIKECRKYLRNCLVFPRNLGEGKLALDGDNDVHYLLGKYSAKAGDTAAAEREYRLATCGDMRVADMNYYNDNPVEYIFYAALAYIELGEPQKAQEIAASFDMYCEKHKDDRAEIDYFAVSLPDMLVWEQDIAAKNAAFIAKVKALAEKIREALCSR